MAWGVSEALFDVLGLSVLFWGILMSSVWFRTVAEGFEAFYKIFGILWQLDAFSLLWKVLGGLRHYLTYLLVFRGFLRYSHGFWAVLNDTWKFRSVILCCGVIWGIFVGYERFLKVQRRYPTFWSVLFCSVTFLCFILSGSERLLYVLRHSMKFWRCSEAFWGILWVFECFWNVCECSEGLSDTLGSSDMISGTNNCSG